MKRYIYIMISPTDVRDIFRVETAFPDKVIEDRIDTVEYLLETILGQDYIDLMSMTVPPIEARMVKRAHAYLVMANIMSDRMVLTGFGVVEKKDDYSQPAPVDDIENVARQYVDTASELLHGVKLFPNHKVTEVVLRSQKQIEGFFELKHCK